jgi:LysM repeat protein
MVKRKPGVVLALGGGAVVVMLGLMRSGSGGDSGQSADTLQMTGAGSTYDSTASDVYNSIQPEIDALVKQLEDLQNSQPTPGSPVTTPVSTLPAPVTSKPTPPPRTTPKPAPSKASTMKASTAKTVTVKKGDTLSAIAQRYGISMATLRKLNPTYWANPKYKSGHDIWSGDKVRVR